MFDTRKAFEILGLNENASLEKIKNRYKVLAKRVHPDITHIESDAIYALNLAYDIAAEECVRKTREKEEAFVNEERKAKLRHNLTLILKGLRLAMKKYVSDLALSKNKNVIRENRLFELTILLEYLSALEKDSENRQYMLTHSFINGIISFEMLPSDFNTNSVSERKACLLYNAIIKQVVRILEEVFIRLDGIKKRTGLWKYYSEKTLEDYHALLEIGAPKISETLDFLPTLISNTSEIAYLLREYTSLLTYKDFFDIFKKGKFLALLKGKSTTTSYF